MPAPWLLVTRLWLLVAATGLWALAPVCFPLAAPTIAAKLAQAVWRGRGICLRGKQRSKASPSHFPWLLVSLIFFNARPRIYTFSHSLKGGGSEPLCFGGQRPGRKRRWSNGLGGVGKQMSESTAAVQPAPGRAQCDFHSETPNEVRKITNCIYRPILTA